MHRISALELFEAREKGDVVVFDVRWALADEAAGRAAYEANHVPGAHYLHLEEDLSDPEAEVAGQMPAPDELAARLGDLGVGEETLVVAYDDDVIYTASRLVWMLAVLGHDRAVILEGGWPAWRRSGAPVERRTPEPARPRRLDARPRPRLRLERGQVERAVSERRTLLDCRMDATWESSGAHIPGARRLPAPALTDPMHQRLESPERTRGRLDEMGIGREEEVVLYCGGGVSAARAWIALTEAGYDAGVYDGSWSEWSQDPQLPKEAH